MVISINVQRLTEMCFRAFLNESLEVKDGSPVESPLKRLTPGK